MEELKLLVEMVAKLPTLAIWVVALFYAYKVVIIGSVYGLIRFIVTKLHDYKCNRTATIKLQDKFTGMVITSDYTMDKLTAQLKRISGKNANGSLYIHTSSVEWLKEAIDAKEGLK